ncbi:13532_t:CDS:2 [Funneliformis geosporum]|uniref:13532_t:CDS:1 n=1 Tax=Funneliformis geosporum TaxID=1117311 RepID=A0A9W4SA02_9GLOM|nr:13532_t:CDS:2 [Funneliformis geosporum]
MRYTPTGQTALDNVKYYPQKPNGERIRVSSQNKVHPGYKRPDGTYSDARVLTIHELLILFSLPTD